MHFNKYQDFAQRTTSTKSSQDKQMNGLLGLNGEVGELTDMYKKYFFQGHELDLVEVKKELGDILWYVAEMCTGIGIDMDTVAELNIHKLKLRYPEGFDSNRSVNRND